MIEVINKLNNELEKSGIKSIYTLITNDVDVDVIVRLIEKNTSSYNQLGDDTKAELVKYLKGLKLESKLIMAF